MQLFAAILLAATLPAADTEVIRGVFEPYVAGTIASFGCPGPAQTNVAFQCDGTLADGGRFKVDVLLGSDGVYVVGPIVYDASVPSAFVNDVRDYVSAGSTLQSVRCTLPGGTPDSFECQAMFTVGTPTPMLVGKRKDGTLQIYGVRVVASKPIPWLRPLVGAFGLLGMALLILALVQILRIRARSMVVTLPLVAEQTVLLPSAGDYILNADAPRFSAAFAGLTFSLREPATGREMASFPAIFRAQSAGITRVRMALRRFFVDAAGEYVLRIDGLGARDASEASIVLTRAWTPLQYLWVALAAASGVMMIVGMFLFLAG